MSLLEKIDCHLLCGTSSGPTGIAKHIVSGREMRYWQIEELDSLLNADSSPRFQWDEKWENIADTPFLILHTSGSSGVPKPIRVTHRLMSTIDCHQLLSDVSGRQVMARAWADESVFTCFPPFHVSLYRL